MTERDEWGETAEERHARILARDLAWLAVSEGHARDGVPCKPVDRLHFEAGWAACYAEYIRLGAVLDPELKGEALTQDEYLGGVGKPVREDTLALRSRIQRVLGMHVDEEVDDPDAPGETLTICAACHEITGGELCTTRKILTGVFDA